MTANAYPPHNPFPYQGALSIEGTTVSMQEDQTLPHQPTLLRDPVQELRRKALKYLERYRANIQGQGQIVVLSGDHGSGKTHSIRYLMGEVASGKLLSPADHVLPLQLYAKAEGSDFLKIYQQITGKIPLPLLRQLSLRFFGVLAGNQIARDSQNPELGLAEAEKLRRDPHRIFDLFRDYRVEEGAVEELQIKEVERVAGGIDDFKRAFSYLLTDHLSTEAYNWLTAQPVQVDHLRKLGVSGEIRSAEVAKWGLQLLTTIFNRAGHPLMIYLDQYEKLVLTPQGEIVGQNMGLLHSLVEVLPRENAMLVISGNREAWQALARDLKQRFAFNFIEFSVLTPEEAQLLLYVYLRPRAEWDDHLPSPHLSDKNLYPFTEEAILKTITYSGGNPRRLLQTCAEAFEEALPEHKVIDADLIEAMLQKRPQLYFDKETIRVEIRQMLNQGGYRFDENYSITPKSVDFAILDVRSVPRCLIKLRDAMFYDSEVSAALEELNLVERVRQAQLPANCVFVILGYVSPEVTHTLKRFAPEYVIYNPETFRQNFGAILERLQALLAAESQSTASPQPEISRVPINIEVSQTTAELELIKQELQRLQSARDGEARLLEQRLEQLFQSQKIQRFNERHQATRDAWVEERGKIEAQIQQVRESNRQQELLELARLRQQAEHLQRRTLLLQALLSFLLAFVVLLAFLSKQAGVNFAPGPFRIPTELIVISILAPLVYFSPLLLKAFRIFETKMERDLWSPVSSLKELDQLVRPYAVRVSPRFQGSEFDLVIKIYLLFMPFLQFLPSFSNRYTTRNLLQHANPHFRYLGVLSIVPVEVDRADPFIRKFLEFSLQSERSSFVRRALARKLARAEEFSIDLLKHMDEPVEALTETVYLIEGHYEFLPRRTSLQRWDSLRTVAQAAADQNPAAALANLLSKKVPARTVDELMAAFQAGLDRHLSNALAEINEAELRRVIRELSPFEAGGLGTYDELQSIDLVDRLYIFFRQYLFYLERNMIGDSVPKSA